MAEITQAFHTIKDVKTNFINIFFNAHFSSLS